METIQLQSKTKALEGSIELYWFENEHLGLKRTLYHRIYIPLQPFDSGIEYESQPVETEIVMEWLELNPDNPMRLDGIQLTTTPEDNTEISIYLGNAHNPCDINSLTLKQLKDNLYEVEATLFIEFEYEGVAKNENFSFKTNLVLNPKIKN